MKMESAPKLNTKYEHLDKGIKPIMTCIGIPEELGRIAGKPFGHFDERFKGNNVTNVAYFHKAPGFSDENILNEKNKNYVISKLDSTNKYSEEFIDCTSIIASGVDKETGENISFLSHQNPKEFLFFQKGKFLAELNERLDELKIRSKEGTIDTIILGGKFPLVGVAKLASNSSSSRENYTKSIELLSSEIEKNLGFKSEIINGPKTKPGQDDIFYDNKKRRVYFMRPEVSSNTQSFTMDSFENQKEDGF